ncbi:MAG: phosphatase PAP2 family protein [Thermoanaerobaculia bacterium]|nr:phosphatase PAP2 family protein [Thermoanaerobaculia bacterium]
MSWKRYWNRMRADGGRELYWLLALLVLALSAWIFVEVAGEVMEGGAQAMDRALLLALRSPTDLSDPLGPVWAEELMRDFTALGANGILILTTLLAAGALFLARKPHAAWALIVAVGLGLGASFLLKSAFDRPRPDLVPHGTLVRTRSFPSGHAMGSALTYLTLAALLARQTAELRLKLYFFAGALLLTILVGISRVYLGVHWPTDILAGWTAGVFWAILSWTAVRSLQRRGRVEGEER